MLEDPRDWAPTGDEDRVIKAFCQWLKNEGWSVTREVQFVDVVAERSGEHLYAEAKGETAGNKRKNVDSLYGQLLRRMPPEEVGEARFAVVVPETAKEAALNVPKRVRELLRINVFVVDKAGG